MKQVSIQVKRLGPIMDATVKMAPLMVFSGESGIGKSYLSALVHYIYLLLSNSIRIRNFIQEKNIKDVLKEIKSSNVKKSIFNINTSELTEWINKDSIEYVRYLIGNINLEGEVSFDLNLSQNDFEYTAEQFMSGMENDEDVTYLIRSNGLNYSITSNNPTEDMVISAISLLLIANINRQLSTEENNRLFFKNVFLMPPSRGSLLDIANLTSLATSNPNMPLFRAGMYTEFIKNYESIFSVNDIKSQDDLAESKICEKLSILNKGKITRSQAGLNYEMATGKIIPLSSAAASIKELAPLSMFFYKNKPIDSSIWFEEPEAHLHPEKQIVIADLISCIIAEGGHMQITTHSDYFLQRLSNLILLHKLKSNNSERCKKIQLEYSIDDKSLLNPEQIQAYYLKRTANGDTKVVPQDSSFGIKFDSFENAIDNDLALSSDIELASNNE